MSDSPKHEQVPDAPSSHEPTPARPYFMPAEWQPQAAMWLSWPHNEETWPENLRAAQHEFKSLVAAIAEGQQVNIMAGPKCREAAASALGAITNVTLVDIPTNDAWARDYAPTFVLGANRQLASVDWHYNAWGGKYPPFEADQRVAAAVAKHLGVPNIQPGFCFEGGAVEVNDSRMLLTTRSCAFDPNRNPDMTREQVEQILQNALGVQAIVWLGGDAIEGDDTDGHIDQLARFTDDTTIVYAWSNHADDPQRPGLELNLRDLESGLANQTLISDARLIPLPIPTAIYYCDRRVPASYCNFLITNERVIVPQFGAPEDEIALRTLTPLFPSREVVGLPSLNLSVGLGSFHCLSQQQPATVTTSLASETDGTGNTEA